jgi:hypothetical protein
VKVAALPVTQVVDYDIAGLRADLKTDFNFTRVLDTQVVPPSSSRKEIDFSGLTAFGAALVQQAAPFMEGLSDASKLDALIQKLYQTIQVKQQNELRFEPELRAAGRDQLRFELMKLSLLHDSLAAPSKAFVDGIAGGDFKGLLASALATIPTNVHSTTTSQEDTNCWVGTRLEVELPVSHQGEESGIKKKDLAPEVINQRFMWVDDYFHYEDWRAKQKEVFDNFNLLVVPTTTPKYFFDQDSRRIPQGVFPYPTHKRQLMLPAANHTLVETLANPNHDEFVRFEKEPHKMMVLTELNKGASLKPIDDDTSMITNLQNIKQGLKADYTDSEILTTILSNLSFTE